MFSSRVFRKTLILGVFVLMWEVYARHLNYSLLFPTFSETVVAFVEGLRSGELSGRIVNSLGLLSMGFAIGVTLALLLTIIAISSSIGRDVFTTLASMLNPLPGISLIPLSLLWFGVGVRSVVFVIVHSVLWTIALNTYSGIQAVPPTLCMVGRNYGLGGIRFLFGILLPAALPSVLAGLKIAWGFAWRTLIAAELVFGVSSGSGGLGWFIYYNKNNLNIPMVFAGLLAIIIIGFTIENVVFKIIESMTVKKWGMQRDRV